jgi:hypothetical protein
LCLVGSLFIIIACSLFLVLFSNNRIHCIQPTTDDFLKWFFFYYYFSALCGTGRSTNFAATRYLPQGTRIMCQYNDLDLVSYDFVYLQTMSCNFCIFCFLISLFNFMFKQLV